MAQSVVDGVVAPAGGFQNGGWYNGRQYWDGRLGDQGVIINPNQTGYGAVVSAEVQKQSNPNAPVLGNPQASNPLPQGSSYGASNTNAAAALGTGTQQPTIDINKIYSDNINSAEVTAAKQKIAEADSLITEKKQALADQLSKIADNPWYSEATLQGKLKKLQDKADNEINNLISERDGYVNSYNSLKADAETKTNLALKQYDINSQEYQNTLSKFNMLLSAGALSNASEGDLAALSTSTGIPLSMISSIITTQKNSQVAPQILTSTDDGGNVTYTVIDQNTGNIIKQSSLGSIGKADSGGSATGAKVGSAQYVAENKGAIAQYMTGNRNSYGHVGPETWNEALKAYLADSLGSVDDFIKEYASFTDPYRKDFQSAYGFGASKRDDLVGY